MIYYGYNDVIIYLHIQNMEAPVMIHKLFWSFVVDSESPSLNMHIINKK